MKFRTVIRYRTVKKILSLFVYVSAVLVMSFTTFGYNHIDEYGEEYEEELSEYDFTDIDNALKEDDIDFKQLVIRLAGGDSEGVFYELFTIIMDRLFGDILYNRSVLVKIIFIAIISAMFTNMSIIIKKSEMSETGFYVTYMLMVTILTGGFIVMSDMVREAVSRIITFMNALVPAFLLSVGVAAGSMSAAGFSGVILMAIGIIEKLILSFLIPAVNVYVIIRLVNNIVEEDYFSKLAGVIKTSILWALKGMVGVLLGANIIQSIIMPSVDAAGTGVVNKLINILPGGEAVTGIEGIVTTTGNVIKNAIGSAGLIALAVICLFPMIKMLIYIAVYKVTSAIIQPIADKRLGDSIDAVSEGIGILYKVTFTVAFLLFITVAIICFSTNIKIGV